MTSIKKLIKMFVNSFNVFFYSFAVITVVERVHDAYLHVDRGIKVDVAVEGVKFTQ